VDKKKEAPGIGGGHRAGAAGTNRKDLRDGRTKSAAPGVAPLRRRFATFRGRGDGRWRRPLDELPGKLLAARPGEAAARQVASATRSPVRVAQLALPAFTKIARAWPRELRKWARASFTGAACTWFRVKIAAADAGRSERISAKSSRFSFRMPA